MSEKPKKDTYCAIRFYGIRPTVTTATLQSCCKTSRHPLSEGLNSLGLVRGRMESLAGIRSKECAECWNVEDKGGVSRRQRHNNGRVASEHETRPTSVFIDEIKEMDLMPSNTCNVHCIYCSPEYSSKIAKDIERHGYYPGVQRNNGEILLPRAEQEKAKEQIEQMFIDQLKSLKSILFSGGEPVLDKSFWKYTKLIVDREKRGMEIRILTNGMISSNLKDRLIRRMEELSKNNTVQLNVSIDALDPYQSYIRFGTNAETIIKNVEEIKNCIPGLMLNFTPTITSMNLLVFTDFMKRLDSLNLPGNVKVVLGIVRGPMEVAAMCLPTEIIDAQIKLVDEYIESNPDSILTPYAWSPIKATLLKPEGYGTHLLPTLFEHLKERDWRLGIDSTPILELFKSHGITP